MRRVFILLMFITANAQAFTWQDLWWTRDQQAMELMQKKHYKEAQSRFENPAWSGVAAYKAGDFQQAANHFQHVKNALGHYNTGNALAMAGQYEQALKEYDQALTLKPDDEDAVYNRKLVADLLKKQPKKNNDDNQKQDKQKKESKDKNKSTKNEQQQRQDQENKDQEKSKSDPQKESEQKKNQSQNQHKSADEKNTEKKDQNKPAKAEDKSPSEREKQQARQQWLRLIPDDPSGLIREKFLRDHIRRQQGWYQ